MNHVSKKDLETLTSQMGRVPEGVCEVEVRDRDELPVVIRVSPMVRQRPFPNLYWLCHAQLCKKIDHLEAGGLIKKLENEVLPQNSELQNALVLAHQLYRDRRRRYLQELPDWDHLPASFQHSLEQRGVGGISDFHRVRCLHTHYAHHLVAPNENPIGAYLDENYPQLRASL